MSKVIQKRVKDLSLDDFIYNIPSDEGGSGGGSSGPHTHQISDVIGLDAKLGQLSSNTGEISSKTGQLSFKVDNLSAKVAALSPSCDASNVYFSSNLILNVPFGRFGAEGGEYILSCAGMTFQQLLSVAFTTPPPEPGPEPEPRPFYWGAYTFDEDYPDLSEDLSNAASVDLKDSTHFASGDSFPQDGEVVALPQKSKIVIFAAPAGTWDKTIKMTDPVLHSEFTFANNGRKIENHLSVLDSNTGEQAPYDFWYYKPKGEGLVGDPNNYEISWIG